MKILEITFDEPATPKRIDQILAEVPEIQSRTYAQKLIAGGCIRLSQPDARGKPCKMIVDSPSQKVYAVTFITITLPAPKKLDLTPVSLPLDILFEDKDVIVINKPQGLVVHPGAGTFEPTLVHGILAHCRDLSGIGGVERPGIVHRIDKDTSGALVICKNNNAHRLLSEQFKAHTVQRKYLALVYGQPQQSAGWIESHLARHPKDRKRFWVTTEQGRWAKTHFQLLQTFTPLSLLALKLETGRTHQIRVHLTHLGLPILGDKIYGNFNLLKQKNPRLFQFHQKLAGQFLHAEELGFVHPTSGEFLLFHAPLPETHAHFIQWLSTGDKLHQQIPLP